MNMSDMGWIRYMTEIEEDNYKMCETTRRKYGLIVSDDLYSFDCSECELNKKC